jgi:predicted kinase
MPKLTLIRGLPGSGKSTMARKIAIDTGALHVEADMWVNYSQPYTPEAAVSAHAICQSMVCHELVLGGSAVVSNTFTRQWEMQPYLDMARHYGSGVEIITATGDYGSVHNVPESAIQAMRERWEEVAV